MKQPMKDSAELDGGVEGPLAPNSLAMDVEAEAGSRSL